MLLLCERLNNIGLDSDMVFKFILICDDTDNTSIIMQLALGQSGHFEGLIKKLINAMIKACLRTSQNFLWGRINNTYYNN